MSTCRVISLFAGIGGFDLAFERAGFEVAAHVERDKACRRLLAQRFPKSAPMDDVCTASHETLPQCDVLVGGWPCQDLSVAGKRAGLAGERSGLFYEFARLAHELQPAFLVWENVPGLSSSDDGRDLARVLLHLGERGYFGACRVLDAQYFGLAQRRLDSGAERCAQVLSLTEGVRWHPAPRREAREGVAGTLGRSSQSGGFRTTDLDTTGAFIPEVCGTLSDGAHNGGGLTDRTPTPDASSLPTVAWALQERDGKGADSATKEGHLIPMLQGGFFDVSAFDPQSGGDCRGLDLKAVPNALQRGQVSAVCFDTTQITSPGNYSNPKPGDACHPLAAGAHAPAVQVQWASGGGQVENPTAQALRAGAETNYQFARIANAVRRLTPRECERLQGFPDDWTAGFPDSTRYKMLGNAVAVPVVEWIARRLMKEMQP